MIKKVDHILNNNFLIPSLSLLFHLYPFLFSLPSEQRTKKPNPRSPHLHQRQRRSTAGLYVYQSSSPQLALQDLASNRAFVTAESSFRITHTDFSVFWVFFFPVFLTNWVERRDLCCCMSMVFFFFFLRWNGAGWRELWRWVESSRFTAAGVIFVAMWSLGREKRRE